MCVCFVIVKGNLKAKILALSSRRSSGKITVSDTCILGRYSLLVYQMTPYYILESGIYKRHGRDGKTHILKLNQPELNEMLFYSLYLEWGLRKSVYTLVLLSLRIRPVVYARKQKLS